MHRYSTTTVKSSRFSICFQGISWLLLCFHILWWFKLANIYIQVSALHSGVKQGIHLRICNFMWNRFPIKNLLMDSLHTPIVDSTYLNIQLPSWIFVWQLLRIDASGHWDLKIQLKQHASVQCLMGALDLSSGCGILFSFWHQHYYSKCKWKPFLFLHCCHKMYV